MAAKKYTYVWISFIVLIFGILVIPSIIARLKSGAVVTSDRLSIPNNSGALSFLTLNGEKRKVPSFSFYNQDSLMISEKDYKNKVYVVEFFFTTCPTICPVMSKNLVYVQNTLKDVENFGIASFSINPVNDTPKVLKEYAQQYGIESLDWHLLSGPLEEVFTLANEGFNIFAQQVPNAPGGFEHAGMFALVDKQGYLRSRVDPFGNPIIYYRGAIDHEIGVNDHGETDQIEALIVDIKKLLEE
ncbi:MAG: protein SCO1/2 [Arcticibacterium sp.]|jgi:protein SCO1/2|tara:strand:+ start:2230 stop:2958 length:729 start_codon:yes stop_codon:yes gene_type:complete